MTGTMTSATACIVNAGRSVAAAFDAAHGATGMHCSRTSLKVRPRALVSSYDRAVSCSTKVQDARLRSLEQTYASTACRSQSVLRQVTALPSPRGCVTGLPRARD